jgi:hypothetical protein
LEGFLKKLGEKSAEGVSLAISTAFHATKKVAGHCLKRVARRARGGSLSLDFPIGMGSVRLVFPADLDGEHMRTALSEIDPVVEKGAAAIRRSIELRNWDYAHYLEGDPFSRTTQIGDTYSERIFV